MSQGAMHSQMLGHKDCDTRQGRAMHNRAHRRSHEPRETKQTADGDQDPRDKSVPVVRGAFLVLVVRGVDQAVCDVIVEPGRVP